MTTPQAYNVRRYVILSTIDILNKFIKYYFDYISLRSIVLFINNLYKRYNIRMNVMLADWKIIMAILKLNCFSSIRSALPSYALKNIYIHVIIRVFII